MSLNQVSVTVRHHYSSVALSRSSFKVMDRSEVTNFSNNCWRSGFFFFLSVLICQKAQFGRKIAD